MAYHHSAHNSSHYLRFGVRSSSRSMIINGLLDLFFEIVRCNDFVVYM